MLSRLPRSLFRQGSRAYAAAAADSTPPIQLFGVDGTYASALYSASIKSGSLDSVSNALQKLQSTLKNDSKVSTLISNPTLNNADKNTIVEVLAKSVGGDKSITNLLKVMAENNRLGMLPAVGEAFASLISAQKGETDVVITSAQVLKQLENSLSKSKFGGAGKKLKIQNKVNPEILGGLVVEIGDRTIDLSVQNRILKLNKLLTDSI